MMWKKFLLKIRSPITTLSGILLPLFVILLLYIIRSQVSRDPQPAQSFLVDRAHVNLIEDAILQCYNQNRVLFVTPNNSYVQEFYNYTYNRAVASLGHQVVNATWQLYDTEGDVENYVQLSDYGTQLPFLNAAIVFDQPSFDNSQWT